jgi:hypothetical protein
MFVGICSKCGQRSRVEPSVKGDERGNLKHEDGSPVELPACSACGNGGWLHFTLTTTADAGSRRERAANDEERSRHARLFGTDPEAGAT